MTTTTFTKQRVLSEETLVRFRERAADHDVAGRYAVEDLADLGEAGWWTAALPEDLGGLGLNLAELGREQRRMARYSPATALSTCMHHYWVGLAADLRRMGLPEAGLIIRYVVAGDILASGHAEVGNDIPLALSTTSATRVEGGWRITGRKMFGSLGPHWNRLGFHAMDSSDPNAAVVVHGFVPRDAPGLTTVANWDAQGVRATESHDTVLEDVFVPDSDVLCVVPAGPPSHPAVAVMMVWALTLIANVYVGIAERALEIAVGQAARFHPGTDAFTHETVGKALLGLGGDGPRW